MPIVIINKKAYRQMLAWIHTTGFQYETGGVLLGYKFLWIFYIMGITFPRQIDGATRTSFILNGEEHAEDAKKIMEKFVPYLKLLGIWHSHTTKDYTFSVQDRMTNRLFVEQIGSGLSVIISWQGRKDNIQWFPYFISKNDREFLCKYTMRKQLNT